MEDSFFKVFDSIIEKEGISKKEYIKFSKEKQLSYGKKIRKIVNLLKDKNQKKQDSLMSLQIDLDNQNTEKLIKIIEEYGFPDKEKLNCKEYIAPFLVFVHSQEKYWKKIEKVINIEKNKGRISQGDYDYIMWHLNGRKGSPINLKK
ncbi:hypothetical protein [Polaribacter sp. IC073]|uniref:hypothetical protein n=1 Tax=Polaribacter sp. IC073 TaxID=2508540 RepID=UPI0011BF28C1|nr:hypothetical protein [Polaribacter sp. IC073]TXD49767.1 hypothetical protein ES045_00860 [Polaribacter sp. IC073]